MPALVFYCELEDQFIIVEPHQFLNKILAGKGPCYLLGEL
jgi:hypothetical protein